MVPLVARTEDMTASCAGSSRVIATTIAAYGQRSDGGKDDDAARRRPPRALGAPRA